MSAEIKKEIQLEIAHVLFIDIVSYSKLSMNDQHAAIEELTQPATGWRWHFTPVRKRLRNARWRSAALSRNIRVYNFGWESTAGQLAGWSM